MFSSMYLTWALLLVFFLTSEVSALNNHGNHFDQFYIAGDVDDLLYNLIVEPKALSIDDLKDIGRNKRSARNESDPDDIENDLDKVIFPPNGITVEIEDMILLLEENKHLSFGNQFRETWVSDDDDRLDNDNERATGCQFYTGSVLNEPESKAIVTICDKVNYYGFFTTGGKSYFIEPTVHPVNGHIVYKAKLPKPGDMSDDPRGGMKDDPFANDSASESGPDLNLTPRNGNSAHKERPSRDSETYKTGESKGQTFYMEENISHDGSVNKIKRCSDCEGGGIFNLTGDTFLDNLDFNFSDEDVDETVKKTDEKVIKNDSYDDSDVPAPRVIHWHRKHDDDEVGYFVDTTWETRPYTKTSTGKIITEKWLEIALAVDYTVIDFHGKGRIRQYIMALMNIVSAIYKDPSLEANLHLVMARLIFYDDKKDSMIKEGNAKKSLESVNRWNYRLIGKLAHDEKPHDVAVWLTREYIGGPSGYAPVAGACDRARSTALNKDEGLASAFIIAHEMAHILGLTHDGDIKAGNKCDDEVVKGTIMAPTVTANFNRFVWSSCSKEEFHRSLNKWTCLLNPPKGENHTILTPGTTYTFTMDEQCRMEYGDGYTLCQKFELIEPCTHLWCGHKNNSLYCITKKGPPVEGTQCGFDKWCVDGYCQHVDGRLSGLGAEGGPRAGGWGPWAPWSPCSRPCGYGVRSRSRRCDNPAPERGGAECEGSATETSVCRQARSCWQAPPSDPRAERCAALGSPGRSNDSLPHDTDEEDLLCRVSCVLWDSGEVLRYVEHLPDGTPCSYENEHHICLEGKCQEHGCDGVENSTAREDRCGVCEGSGDTCFDNHLMFNKTLKKDLMRLLVLPRHSRDISIRVSLQSLSETNQIVAYSLFHLALKDRSKRVYRMVIRDPNDMVQIAEQKLDLTSPVWASQEGPAAVLAGTALRVGRPPGALTLQAKGPLHTDLTLLISSPAEYVNAAEATVAANYTLGNQELGRYRWAPEEPESCEACRAPPPPEPAEPDLECVDTKRGNRTVHGSLCARSPKPKLNYDRCNTSCDFHWVPGPWEHCTATCGETGQSHRQVYCVPLAVANDTKKVWRYMVRAENCGDDIPDRERPCNRFVCPSYWTEGLWTKCSSSCAPGISTRPLTCPAADVAACGPRPGLRWRTCHGRCGEAPQCHRDRSPYCALPSLQRYCLIPSFQKLCCRSCQEWFKQRPHILD